MINCVPSMRIGINQPSNGVVVRSSVRISWRSLCSFEDDNDDDDSTHTNMQYVHRIRALRRQLHVDRVWRCVPHPCGHTLSEWAPPSFSPCPTKDTHGARKIEWERYSGLIDIHDILWWRATAIWRRNNEPDHRNCGCVCQCRHFNEMMCNLWLEPKFMCHD